MKTLFEQFKEENPEIYCPQYVETISEHLGAYITWLEEKINSNKIAETKTSESFFHLFEPCKNISSATICNVCGKEKYLHVTDSEYKLLWQHLGKQL